MKDWYPEECESDCGSIYRKYERDFYEYTDEPDFDRLHECVDEWEVCLLGCF